MSNSHPKYSLIIPARNGLSYLPACIETIITQDYQDYELILSDDNSTDGTSEYLKSLQHPNVQVYFPQPGMSMTEHWEWALSRATGEWLIFVGQDDGLQPYFFTLADKLVAHATKAGIRTIMSRRAYYFWPGCEAAYGDVAVNYEAIQRLHVRNSQWDGVLALLGFIDYFDLPEMYTTSLFHKSVLEETKKKQNGAVFLAHPQDANLAAIACSLERKYLLSEIPLGWVGSSPKSAGLAITHNNDGNAKGASASDKTLDALKTEYLNKIQNSKLAYNTIAGEFSFANLALYFWQALIQTPQLRSEAKNRWLRSRLFCTIMFAGVFNEVRHSKDSTVRLPQLKAIIQQNQCVYIYVCICAAGLWAVRGLRNLFCRVRAKWDRTVFGHVYFYKTWSHGHGISLRNASDQVNAQVRAANLLERW